jgi:hypothetical protein
MNINQLKNHHLIGKSTVNVPFLIAMLTGWWLTYPSEKMKVSWNDYSQYMESHKIHVPNHQPVKLPEGNQLY